jgi:hypothetical protein
MVLTGKPMPWTGLEIVLSVDHLPIRPLGIGPVCIDPWAFMAHMPSPFLLMIGVNCQADPMV